MGHKEVTRLFRSRGISDFHTAVDYVSALPYGRNSDRGDYTLVLKEEKGTCSTKHALLAQVCIEHGIEDVQLAMGIYRMSEDNTPGVGVVLDQHEIDYIPEAHCYLIYKDMRFDFTSPDMSDAITSQVIYEERIRPADIASYKLQVHQKYIQKWVQKALSHYNSQDIWEIREKCIKALSHR
ncbi:hypothetical protein [Caldalkalibacillus salinus]|uniref:hypothetical protein n=1 Tax=Caldalkalibacillus salinus TaxID=2803787 RepID=UPI0019223B1F|nr:hypothetical protein [Caldalkalibacillus salinus]